MSGVFKKCAFCNKSFDIKKNRDRISLEFRFKNEFRKEYFCCRECFADYVKKSI